MSYFCESNLIFPAVSGVRAWQAHLQLLTPYSPSFHSLYPSIDRVFKLSSLDGQIYPQSRMIFEFVCFIFNISVMRP